ncbi:iron complex transport system permease protein [Sporomusaceae bacterium BoRhaA]|uniref:FecCD family ABC transporter permease n=1 Tax=Pelorhabdus rhamnosifermentans TaxID=2772457 RepID=UPI001C063F57|nr:iron ABC transporter permease [Pelorhabdus rhamnosifermentans]MBU2703475.1 iron complex transport system permease protein [Pelorhabdus rhamnosifermentans]
MKISIQSVKLLVLLLLLLVVFFLSFMIGRYPLPLDTVLSILLSKFFVLPGHWIDNMETIVMKVRLPRIAAAVLVGGALSVAGATYQNLFRNPLVSPAILGVSAGAGFGAALGMVLHFSWAFVQMGAFAMGLVAVICSVGISYFFGNKLIVTLVLGGMVMAALFHALISILMYLADPLDTLPSITFWLMGGISKVTLHDVYWSLPPILISIAVLYAIRWQINVMSMGEEEAYTLGVNVKFIRILVLFCATLMTAAAVSISGVIGWVGLLIPHMARMLVGANFQVLLPASLLLGSTYLLLMDDLARSVASVEIPVGILTALLGAPFFIFLLARSKKQWIN